MYADDFCLMASSLEHLQGLIDALGVFCNTIYMEISVAKTKVMIVSITVSTIGNFTCTGQPVGQVLNFRYLGMHFDTSGSICHLIMPLRAKAAGS